MEDKHPKNCTFKEKKVGQRQYGILAVLGLLLNSLGGDKGLLALFGSPTWVFLTIEDFGWGLCAIGICMLYRLAHIHDMAVKHQKKLPRSFGEHLKNAREWWEEAQRDNSDTRQCLINMNGCLYAAVGVNCERWQEVHDRVETTVPLGREACVWVIENASDTYFTMPDGQPLLGKAAVAILIRGYSPLYTQSEVIDVLTKQYLKSFGDTRQ